MTDFYAVLGVHPTATTEQIKIAYRQKARQLHPDLAKTPDATGRMAALNGAYAILSDPAKRLEYDRTRTASAAAFQPPNAVVAGVVSVLKSILSDPVAVGAIGDIIVSISKRSEKRSNLFDLEQEEDDWGL